MRAAKGVSNVPPQPKYLVDNARRAAELHLEPSTRSAVIPVDTTAEYEKAEPRAAMSNTQHFVGSPVNVSVTAPNPASSKFGHRPIGAGVGVGDVPPRGSTSEASVGDAAVTMAARADATTPTSPTVAVMGRTPVAALAGRRGGRGGGSTGRSSNAPIEPEALPAILAERVIPSAFETCTRRDTSVLTRQRYFSPSQRRRREDDSEFDGSESNED